MFFINAKAEQYFGREKLMALIAAHKPHARRTNPDKTPLTPPQQAQQATPAPSTRQAAAKPQQRPARARQATAAERAKQAAERLYAAAWPEKAAEGAALTAEEQKSYDALWGAEKETPLNAADAELYEKLYPKSSNH